jgi:hypothetical protein
MAGRKIEISATVSDAVASPFEKQKALPKEGLLVVPTEVARGPIRLSLPLLANSPANEDAHLTRVLLRGGAPSPWSAGVRPAYRVSSPHVQPDGLETKPGRRPLPR